MAKAKKDPVKTAKKDTRDRIAATLESTFAELKEKVGEKRFARKIRKASKVLASGVAKKVKPAKAVEAGH